MRPTTRALLAVALLAAIAGCRKRQAQAPAAPPDARPDAAAPASLQGKQFRFAMGVYHLRRPPKPVGPTLAQLVHRQRLLTLVNAPEGPPDKPVLALVRQPLRELPPPPAAALAHLGRGLTPEQIRALPRSDSVSVLLFTGPGDQAIVSYRQALEIVGALARASSGLIWDEEARLMYAPDAWQMPQQGWTGDGIPDVRRHITVRGAKDGEDLRMVTLGMRRFALPDVVVNQVERGHEALTTVINLVCQRLVEGALVGPGGELELALDDVRHPAVRPPVVPGALARRRATVTLGPADRLPGDPDNQLVEIEFSILVSERRDQQSALLRDLFGSAGADAGR